MPESNSKQNRSEDPAGFVDDLSCGLVHLQIASDGAAHLEDVWVTYVNYAFSQICGLSRDVLINQNIQDVFAENGKDWLDFFSDCLTRHDKGRFYVTLPGDKSRSYAVICRKTEKNRFLVEFHDVTGFLEKERKLEVELAEAIKGKVKSETFFEAIGDAVEIIGPDFRVISENKIARDLHGSSVGDFCYTKRNHTSICDECPSVKAFELGIVQKSETVFHDESGIRYVQTVAAPVLSENGTVTAVVKSARDITKLIHLEQARVRLIKEQQKSMAEVKKLSGLLTICSECKSIKEDGCWSELEGYLRGHSEVEFHTVVCKKCKTNLKKEKESLSI